MCGGGMFTGPESLCLLCIQMRAIVLKCVPVNLWRLNLCTLFLPVVNHNLHRSAHGETNYSYNYSYSLIMHMAFVKWRFILSNECVVLWNIAFPLGVEERTCVSSAGLFNLITNLRRDERYQGLREMMGIPVGHRFFWLIQIARIHLFEQGFSYPLQPLFQHSLPVPVSTAFVWFSCAHFCRDLRFLVIGDDTTQCCAVVRTTANQTQPQDVCEGTELDQLQRRG